jgi:hypothetical protein
MDTSDDLFPTPDIPEPRPPLQQVTGEIPPKEDKVKLKMRQMLASSALTRNWDTLSEKGVLGLEDGA